MSTGNRFFWAVVLGGSITGVSAQTMTCGRDFAKVGDSKTEVSTKCGEPVARDSYCRQSKSGAFDAGAPDASVRRNAQGAIVKTCEDVEEWVYRPGVGQFITTVEFFEGRVRNISTGARDRAR